MKHLKVYESYFSHTISIVFPEEVMMYAFWDVYYPIASKEAEYDTLGFKDYIEGMLDSISGEVTDHLKISLPRYDRELNNLNLDLENFTINIPTNYEVDDEIIEKLDEFLSENLPDFMDNQVNSMDKIEYEIYLNGKLIKSKDNRFDYSSLGQKELKNLIDDALDIRDFEKVKKLSQFLN